MPLRFFKHGSPCEAFTCADTSAGCMDFSEPFVERIPFQDKVVPYKIRMSRQLTALDLEELEHIFTRIGGFSGADIAAGATEVHGLGLFIRSVAGMDRGAVSVAPDAFDGGTALSEIDRIAAPCTGNQLAFLKLIIDQLTLREAVPTGIFYEAPFTDFAPQVSDELFTQSQVTSSLDLLGRVAGTAVAASD